MGEELQGFVPGCFGFDQPVVFLPLVTDSHEAVADDLDGNAQAAALDGSNAFGQFIGSNGVKADVELLFDLCKKLLNTGSRHALKLVDAAAAVELRIRDLFGALLKPYLQVVGGCKNEGRVQPGVIPDVAQHIQLLNAADPIAAGAEGVTFVDEERGVAASVVQEINQIPDGVVAGA